MSQRHFFVFVNHQKAPTRRHGYAEQARAEAQRLADKTGERAWVLVSLGWVKPTAHPSDNSSLGISGSGDGTT